MKLEDYRVESTHSVSVHYSCPKDACKHWHWSCALLSSAWWRRHVAPKSCVHGITAQNSV